MHNCFQKTITEYFIFVTFLISISEKIFLNCCWVADKLGYISFDDLCKKEKIDLVEWILLITIQNA
jgi:hypothetical protein